MPFAQPPLMFVVRHHRHDVDRQIAGRPAVEQVVEAMAALRHRDDEARFCRAVADPRIHRKAVDDRRERRLHARQPLGKPRTRAAKGDAHEETSRIEVGILLAVEDEAVALGEQPGHRGDDADRIDAAEGQDIRSGQIASLPIQTNV